MQVAQPDAATDAFGPLHRGHLLIVSYFEIVRSQLRNCQLTRFPARSRSSLSSKHIGRFDTGGGDHEPVASTLHTLRRVCSHSAGAIADRTGANNLSGAASANDRGFRGGRPTRRSLAPNRAMALGTFRPAIHH